MAGTKILTRIATWLGIDSSGVDKGMIKAEKAVKRGQQRIGKSTKAMKQDFLGVSSAVKSFGLAIGGALTVGGIARFTHTTAQALDTVGKLSERLGLSTEFLSEMGFAAERSGVKTQTFQLAMQKLIRRLEEFRDTGGGPAARAIEILGTDFENAVRSGEPFEKLFSRLADEMQGMTNQADKLRVAEALLESEGVSLVQILQQGSEGIENLRQAARDAGATMSKDATDAAAKYNDALLDLKTTLISIGIAGAPFMEFLADVFKEIEKQIRITKEWVNLLERTFGGGGGGARVDPVDQLQFRTDQRRSQIRGQRISPSANPPIFPGMGAAAAGPPAPGSMSLAEPLRVGTQALGEYAQAFQQAFGPDGAVGITMLEFEQNLTDLAQNRIPTEFEAVMAQFQVTAADFYNVLGEATMAFSQAIGDSVATALVEQENFVEALSAMLKNVLKQILSALVKLMVQFILFNTILSTTFGFFGASIPGLGGFGGGGGTGGGASISPGLFGGTPSFHDGGSILKSGLAMVHKGETVVPAEGTGPFGGLTVEMDGRIVGQIVADRIGSAAQGRGFRS